MLRPVTLVAVVALAAATGAAAGGSATAFVALPALAHVVAVDVASGKVLREIPVARGPEDVAAFHDLSRRRDFVLVTSPPSGAVTLIDAISQRVVKVWRGFSRPVDVVVDRPRAYVVDAGRGEVVVLDLRTRRTVGRVDVGAMPAAIAVSDLVVVAHERDRRLTLIDPARLRVVGTIAVHRPVASLSKQPDTANVYIAFAGSGELALVDWGLRRTIFRRVVGERLAEVVKDIYVGDRVWAADSARARVIVASSRDGRVQRRLNGCRGARDLAQVGTASVVATCAGETSIAVWDTTRWRLRRFGLRGRPAGVAVAVIP